MSVEDKIRRAEEIYNRRRENEYKSTNTRVRVENTRETTNQKINKRLKKMIVQIIVCMLIYLSFHYIVKSDYIFSADFKNKCEEILAYDISFNELYKNISNSIIVLQEKYQTTVENKSTNDDNEGGQEEQKETHENIGGAEKEIAKTEESLETEKLSEEEQMKKDAEDIKAKISFIKPLSGTITSVFGWRNPKLSTVSKYHTGIDIAANEGTDIISATSGEVILASSEGAYGNHLKIKIEDIIIIYAHCSSLLVKEGDEISQGQVIAKVGSTGNSTGPHLHFEIRKEDRYVNPDLILDF